MAFATNLLSRNLRLISRFSTKHRMMSSDNDGQPPKRPGTTNQPLLIKESGLEIDDSVKIAMEVFRKKFARGLIDRVVVKDGSKGMAFSSKTYKVEMEGPLDHFELFVKYLPESLSDEVAAGYKVMFNRETTFYRTSYPMIFEHQKLKRIANPFNNVVKFYPVHREIGNPIVFLEDISAKGYVVAYDDKRKLHGDQHVRFVMNMLAKYHGSLFAIKEQHADLYQKFHDDGQDELQICFTRFDMGVKLNNYINFVKEQLIAQGKTEIIPHLDGLAYKLVGLAIMLTHERDEYNVLCHGDVHGNNLMFLYDEKAGKIEDAKIVDWQLPKVHSPVIDVSNYFYTCASKDILNNIDSYLELYYNQLSEHISNMGSNPSKLYPRETFDQHWRKFSKYGLLWSFFVTRSNLYERDEIPEFQNVTAKEMTRPIRNQKAYNQRMIDILEHFVERKQL